MRRHLAAVAGLLLTLTACADDAEPRRQGPGAGTTADPAVVAKHADDVLVSVHSTGGEGHPGGHVPDVEVRADGTVYLAGEDGFGVDTATLGLDDLAKVRDAFEDVSFRQADYAESPRTDQPSTSVYSTIGGRPEQISVYGFGHDEDVDDEDWDRLESALDTLRDLTESRRAPYTPERLAVLLTPSDDADDADDGNDTTGAAGADWPLAEPLHRTQQRWGDRGRACLLATGDDVTAIGRLLDDGNDADHRWSTGAPPSSGVPAAVDVEIRPLLPGTGNACTTAAPDRLSVGAFYSVAPGDPTGWKALGPADRWRVPTPLELQAVVDEVEAAATEATGQGYPEGQLHSYDTRWVAGTHDGRTYVEVAGDYPEKYRDDRPDVPTSWQVRVDLVSGAVVSRASRG